MHQSAYDLVEHALKTYLDLQKHQVVLDIGSRVVSGQRLTHRTLIDAAGLKYVGLDVVAGPNVDVVMREPYRLPVKSESADVILSGQVFEHIPYFWVTFLEMARVLTYDGIIIVTAPSRGHRHSPPTDCWRFYPDGMLALAKYSGLNLLHAHTDFPRVVGKRFDYSSISPKRYWGDTVGVFQKTKQYPKFAIAVVREVMIRWANNKNELKPRVARQSSD